jgi:hypothetical protein
VISTSQASKIAILELDEEAVRFFCWYSVEVITALCHQPSSGELRDGMVFIQPMDGGVTKEDTTRGSALSRWLRERVAEIMEEHLNRN